MLVAVLVLLSIPYYSMQLAATKWVDAWIAIGIVESKTRQQATIRNKFAKNDTYGAQKLNRLPFALFFIKCECILLGWTVDYDLTT